MRAVALYACGCLLLSAAAPARAQQRCIEVPPVRTCTGEVGPVRTRTVAESVGGDVTEAEVVAAAKYADSPGYARAVGGLQLQLVPFSTLTERANLFVRLMKARRQPGVPWVRFGRYDWRALEGDGIVRVEARRMER